MTKLHKISAILFTSFSFTACGPKPTICISRPSDKLFRCFDYQAKKKVQMTLSQVDKWSCISGVDFNNELDACKRKQAGPLVNACIVRAVDGEFHCFDQATQKANLINFADTAHFVCASPQDQDILLTYCKDLASQ